MTRSQAEALRRDGAHWRLGLVYICRDDPRVVVRNRMAVGWTFNFGHPRVLPTIVGFVALALTPPGLLLAAGVTHPASLLAAGALSAALVIRLAHHIASGPYE